VLGTPQPAEAAPPPRNPPSGPGWVFQLRGHHFHNPKNQFGAAFVAETFLRQMQQDEVALPPGETWTGGPQTFPLRKLGLGFPVLITDENVDWDYELPIDADEDSALADEGKEGKADGKAAAKKKPARNNRRGGGMVFGVGADQPQTPTIPAPRYDFVIQFCWQIPPPETMVELARIYPGDVPDAPVEDDSKEAAPRDAAAAGDSAKAAPAEEAENTAAGPPPQPAQAKDSDGVADSAATDEKE
jgi:hypothetical protein